MIKVFKKQEGLGDTVELLTTITGIKAAVDAYSKATGKDCGCSGRKNKLNERFSYGNKQDK